MKLFQFFFITLLALVATTATSAFAQTDSKPFGSKAETVLTVNDTLEVDTVAILPKYTSQMYTIAADTVNVVVQADTKKAFTGNRLLFKVAASSQTRYITFSDSLQAPADSVAASKIRIWEFVYVGDKFVLLSRCSEY